MRRIILGLATMVLLLVGSGVAMAEGFQFVWQSIGGTNVGSDFSLYIAINTVDQGNGAYLVVSGGGTLINNGQTYNLTLYPNPSPPDLQDSHLNPPIEAGFNDMLYPYTNRIVDDSYSGGLWFTIDNGNEALIAALDDNLYIWDEGNQAGDTVTFALLSNAVQVPEPGLILFLGIGIGVVSLLVLRIKA